MQTAARFPLFCCCVALLLTGAPWVRGESPAAAPGPESLPSVEEARHRAEILHETMHATLQVVHLQYFREDEGLAIPAATLRSVFRELGRRQGIQLRWLSVNAQAMNTDHEPKSDFEKEAVQKLSAGQPSHEQTDGETYRRVGAIVLESECLKCHLPTRTDTRPRLAGLLISIPVESK